MDVFWVFALTKSGRSLLMFHSRKNPEDSHIQIEDIGRFGPEDNILTYKGEATRGWRNLQNEKLLDLNCFIKYYYSDQMMDMYI